MSSGNGHCPLHAVGDEGDRQILVANLEHPYARPEKALHEPLEDGHVIPTVDEHAERDSREPVPRPQDRHHPPLKIVEPVANAFETAAGFRGHDSGALLKAPYRLRAAGGVRGHEVGDPGARQRGGSVEALADVASHVTGGTAICQFWPGEHRGQSVSQVLRERRQDHVIEGEADNVLDHPQGLGRTIGRGIDGPPDTGRRPRAARSVWFTRVHNRRLSSFSPL